MCILCGRRLSYAFMRGSAGRDRTLLICTDTPRVTLTWMDHLQTSEHHITFWCSICLLLSPWVFTARMFAVSCMLQYRLTVRVWKPLFTRVCRVAKCARNLCHFRPSVFLSLHRSVGQSLCLSVRHFTYLRWCLSLSVGSSIYPFVRIYQRHLIVRIYMIFDIGDWHKNLSRNTNFFLKSGKNVEQCAWRWMRFLGGFWRY